MHDRTHGLVRISAVAKGIISHYQAFEVIAVKVEITNGKDTLTGVFEDNLNISNAVGKNPVEIFSYNGLSQRFIQFNFPRPSTPSRLFEKYGIKYYLCLERDGILSAKHHCLITETDYLIAELDCDGCNFHFKKDTSTYLEITRF
uniref:Uncharacterized protein n=1 Tax=Panagrolaimus davidi TaxID=227884 RepID=A0A914P884_9BILA